MVLGPADLAAAKKLNYAGAGLTIFSFVLPFLAMALGYISAFSAGQAAGQGLGALVGLIFVTWLALRNKNALTQAKGRFATGFLMVSLAFTSVTKVVREDEQAKDLLRQGIAFAAQQTAKFADLSRRFDEVDLDSVLTPENITSPTAVATGKTTVARFRALLAERRALLQTYRADSGRFIDGLPDGEFKRGFQRTVDTNMNATVRLYADLDRTQTTWSDDISAVLEWSSVQSGKLSMRGTQLMFSSEPQRAELALLTSKLTAAEADLNRVVQATAAAQATAQEKNKANMAEAEKLLAK